MEAMLEREVLLERRQAGIDKASLWEQLTLAQKFSASNLTQFGYDLAFIRSSRAGSMAVMLCDGNAATIVDDGNVDTNPDIVIRP